MGATARDPAYARPACRAGPTPSPSPGSKVGYLTSSSSRFGLGVNNMMFTLIYGTTMRGLPIPDRDRVLSRAETEGVIN